MLLLDEPLGALDLKLRKQMQTELSRIHRQVGTTFVFVTHDQEEALVDVDPDRDHVATARLSRSGTPREVYDHPVDRFVADFVGETNFLQGVVRVGTDGPSWASLAAPVDAPTRSTEGPATLMVRPESLALWRLDAEALGPGITGRIVNVAFLGNHTRITLTTSADDIVLIRPHGTSVRRSVSRGGARRGGLRMVVRGRSGLDL